MQCEVDKPIDPRIAHLADAQVSALVDEYYAGADLAELVARYGLQCNPNRLYELLPPEPAGHCPHCAAPMVRPRAGRSTGSRSLFGRTPARCVECRHVDGAGRCACRSCAALRKQAADHNVRRRQAAIDRYGERLAALARPDRGVDDLSFTQALAVLALTGAYGIAEDGTLRRPARLARPLVPAVGGLDFFSVVGVDLDHSLLTPASTSAEAAFTIEADSVTSVQVDLADWTILVSRPPEFVAELQWRAKLGRPAWPKHWIVQCGSWAVRIAKWEVIEHAQLYMGERRLGLAKEPRLDALAERLLERFSPAQCCRIFWAAARQSSDAVVRAPYLRRNASGVFIACCERWIAQASGAGRPIEPFERDRRLLQSELSYAFFDRLLHLAQQGFSKVPSELAPNEV